MFLLFLPSSHSYCHEGLVQTRPKAVDQMKRRCQALPESCSAECNPKCKERGKSWVSKLKAKKK